MTRSTSSLLGLLAALLLFAPLARDGSDVDDDDAARRGARPMMQNPEAHGASAAGPAACRRARAAARA